MIQSQQKRSGSGRFKHVGSLVFTILGLLLFAYFLKKAGVEEVWTDIRQLGAGFLLVLAISAIRPFVRALAWTRTFDEEHHLSLRDALSAYLIGDALGTLLPLGIFVSEPTKAALVRRRVPLVASLSALVIENIFYSLSVALFIFAGTAALLLSFNLPQPLRIASLVSLAVFLLIIPLALLVIRQRWKFLSSTINFLHRRGLAKSFFERKRASAQDVEDRIYGFYVKSRQRFLSIILLEVCFHLAGVAEVFVTLWFISETRTGLFVAFLLESVNRFINVVFKFVPLRVGVDEAGTGLLAKVLGLTTATGVSLAIVRKARVLVWAGVGVLLIALRGLSWREVTESAQTSNGESADANAATALPANEA